MKRIIKLKHNIAKIACEAIMKTWKEITLFINRTIAKIFRSSLQIESFGSKVNGI
jgi:hypothetical protein